jgi:hypothetical protein
MANPCAAHGGSVQKPGTGELIVASSAAIEAALELLGLGTAAAILAPLIAGETYHLTTMCPADPPAIPTLTVQDMADALNWPEPQTQLPAVDKLRAWFDGWFWFQVCQCADGTVPGAPTLTVPTVPQQSTGLPFTGASGACWDGFDRHVVSTGGSAEFDYSQLLWNDNSTASQKTAVSRKLPSPAPSQITMKFDLAGRTTAQPTRVFTGITWYQANGTTLSFDNQTINFNASMHAERTIVPPSGAAAVAFNFALNQDAPPYSGTLTSEVVMYCSGQSPATPASPCCPPDPSLEYRLQQLIGMVSAIYSALPSNPSSYADSTVHAGLSGNGTVTLQSAALALRVNITTDPNALGVTPGSPDYLYDRGFIVPVINGAPVAGNTRLQFNPQFYPLPSLTEQVGYSLHPGVVATITELVRGP